MNLAFKTVVVATDFSEPSEVAVNYGRDLSRGNTVNMGEAVGVIAASLLSKLCAVSA